MPESSAPFRLAAAKADCERLKHEDPFLAYDIATRAAGEWPGEICFRHVQAFALVQTGPTVGALAVLYPLYAAGHRDSETLGLLGRVWKDQARNGLTEKARAEAWQHAFDFYRQGLEHAEIGSDASGSYPGINAAALSVWLGRIDDARALARRAAELAKRTQPPDYWSVATLAEAALIAGDLEGARTLYLESQSSDPPPSPGKVASTRRQARDLAAHLYGNSAALDDCFKVPPVVVFIGHMTDTPGRKHSRFPKSLVLKVKANLASILSRLHAKVGYASAARGGDLLFLETLHAAKAETQIVLPLEREVFREASVGDEAAWNAAYERALAQASDVRVCNTHSSADDGLAFEFGLRMLIGLARLRARQLETTLHAVVLWDGGPGDGHGGTAWAVTHLRRLRVPVENVFPGHEGPIDKLPPGGDSQPKGPRCIRALLFSDCKGYSHLREEQIGEYTRQFLAGVAKLIDELRETHDAAPITANTWGDGLFLSFADVRAAATFALALRDGVRRRAAELQVPDGVRLRIALHAGPVLPFIDPVTHRENLAGVNVAFAARIEPIAAENQVYVSEPFAALAAEAGLDQFQFDYLGQTEFAKEYGTYRLYQLRKGDAPSR